MDDLERQRIVDGEQLRALAIAYLVLGGMAAFTALISLFYIGMGIFMGVAASTAKGPGAEQSAAFIAALFGFIGLAMFLGFGVLSTLQIWTGASLLRGRRRTLALVTAGLTCVWIPFGTILGALSFVVLLRPSVSDRFREEESRPEAAPPPLPGSPSPPSEPPRS